MKKEKLMDITSVISYQGDYYPYFKFEYLVKNGSEFEIHDELSLSKISRDWNKKCNIEIYIADNKDWIEKSFVKILLQRYFNLNSDKYNYTFLFEKHELEDDDTDITIENIIGDLESRNIIDTLHVMLGLYQRDLLNINDNLINIIERVLRDAE